MHGMCFRLTLCLTEAQVSRKVATRLGGACSSTPKCGGPHEPGYAAQALNLGSTSHGRCWMTSREPCGQ
jgi:hypothetical protein